MDLNVGANSCLVVVDWNNDGRKDIVVGNEAGQVRVYLNSGTNAAPVFTNYTAAITNSTDLYRNSPEVYDLNMDGKKDVIAGNESGYIYFYENIGTDDAPIFNNTGVRLKLKNGSDIHVNYRAHIELADWDANGSLDLIVGDNDGYINLFVNPGGDPLDPCHPTNVSAYSDYNTPTSMALAWTDPTTLYNGTPIAAGDYTIEISRDSLWITSVQGGIQQFTDTGLNDGQSYQYSLITKLISNDSTSMPAVVYWHAGGSPIPGAPENLAGTTSQNQANLTWNDPTTQEDGTPLDDLDSIFVYRNGIKIASVAPGIQAYSDVPPTGFSYNYFITAIDNEIPPNESQHSNEATLFVGDVPNFLVWVGPDAAGLSATSGDSLFQSLVDIGESVYLTNNLFELSSDLSVYEGIFVVLGIYSNNHVIGASDPEGPALEAYLQSGGRLYLEGGDCYNYDPGVGGYNILPWFGLNSGNDGSSDVFGVIGLNSISAFQFAYNGENSFMDELSPQLSTPIWQNNQNSDICGVYFVFNEGRSIGVVPSFGGMVNSNSALNAESRTAGKVAVIPTPSIKKPRSQVKHSEKKPFIKRYGYFPENKAKRKLLTGLAEFTAGGIRILANNKDDLMAAYLGLMGYSATPVLSLSTSLCMDTLQIGSAMNDTLIITNAAISGLAIDLIFSITENPPADWITVMPVADTLARGESSEVIITLDASGLDVGAYSTRLMIACNDPSCILDSVQVHLEVIPQVSVDEPVDNIPKVFAVSQNYPNPFNPATTISYQLPQAADVKIIIFNLLGQEVSTLINKHHPPGTYQIEWNGFSKSGQQAASGIYYYKMLASSSSGTPGDFIQIRKMVLMR